MTTKEKLHGLVDRLDDEHAARALPLLAELVGQGTKSPRPRRAFIGSGSSGRGEISERADELLEDFGK